MQLRAQDLALAVSNIPEVRILKHLASRASLYIAALTKTPPKAGENSLPETPVSSPQLTRQGSSQEELSRGQWLTGFASGNVLGLVGGRPQPGSAEDRPALSQHLPACSS